MKLCQCLHTTHEMQACYSEPQTKTVSVQCHNRQQTQSSSGAIKGLLGTDWLVRHLCKWHRLSGYLSDSWQHRVNLAAQLYGTRLRGILTACRSVQTERESNRKEEDGEERRDGEKARSEGVVVWIQFPVMLQCARDHCFSERTYHLSNLMAVSWGKWRKIEWRPFIKKVGDGVV